MEYGYIKLHRRIMENILWNEKPYSKGQAWVDLLLMANHADNEVLLGNEVFIIKRGQLHTSELKLSKKWGWSRKKVRAYLKLLKNAKMATTIGTTKGTTITIENYSEYQDYGTTKGTAEGTLKEHQKNSEGYTNNNVKNDRECKEVIYVPAARNQIPPALESEIEYCQERNSKVDPKKFCDFYTSKNWYVGKNKMKDWQASVRTWERNIKENEKKSSNPFLEMLREEQYEQNGNEAVTGDSCDSIPKLLQG